MSVATINSYSFGKIVINNHLYNQDVYIDTEGKVSPWQREESHFIRLDDLEKITEENPEVLIIGTGAYGIAKVSPEINTFCQDKKIELIIKPTKEATEEYNRLKDKRTMAYFHLTC